MKKFVFSLALFFLVMGGIELFAQDMYTVDLSTIQVKNDTAFTKNYDYFVIFFDDLPGGINWSNFNRVIIRAKMYNRSGRELRQGNGMAMASIFYEINMSNYSNPSIFDAGANVPLKQYNIGETGPGRISTEKGEGISLKKAPEGIVFQNANETVGFIEVLEITFFKQ